MVPAKNASALIALLSTHLPIPELKYLKRVRGPRPGEYPELFPVCGTVHGARNPATEEGMQGTRGGAAASNAGARSSEKVLLAMIGPQDLVGRLQQHDGGSVYHKLTELCLRFFDGRVPAFPPNTREQFDEWSKVFPCTLQHAIVGRVSVRFCHDVDPFRFAFSRARSCGRSTSARRRAG